MSNLGEQFGRAIMLLLPAMYVGSVVEQATPQGRIAELLQQRGYATYQVVENLVPNDADHLEALLAADRVDDHVAVDADEVFGVEDAVFVLAGGVDHLDGEIMVSVADDLAEGVLDGRVVGVDKVAVDILHGEGGFAWGNEVRRIGRVEM